MKLAGEYLFDGPRDVVWEVLRDPKVLATALPGTQSLEMIEENVYEGKMNVRIGPVAGLFAGKLVVSNEVPPESYTLTVEGKGAPGFGKGSGDCKLTEQGDQTLMTYEGELQVGGTIANVGQRLIETVANSMAKQAFESLNRSLQARLAGEAEGVEEVEYQAPSQTKFAMGVAQDMIVRIFSTEYKSMWITVAIAIIAFAIGFWLGSISGG